MTRSSIACLFKLALLLVVFAGAARFANGQVTVAAATTHPPKVRFHVTLLDVEGAHYETVRSLLEAAAKACGAEFGPHGAVSLAGIFGNDEMSQLVRILTKSKLATVASTALVDGPGPGNWRPQLPIWPVWRNPETGEDETQSVIEFSNVKVRDGRLDLGLRFPQVGVKPNDGGVPLINSRVPYLEVPIGSNQTVAVETWFNTEPVPRGKPSRESFSDGLKPREFRSTGPRRLILIRPEIAKPKPRVKLHTMFLDLPADHYEIVTELLKASAEARGSDTGSQASWVPLVGVFSNGEVSRLIRRFEKRKLASVYFVGTNEGRCEIPTAPVTTEERGATVLQSQPILEVWLKDVERQVVTLEVHPDIRMGNKGEPLRIPSLQMGPGPRSVKIDHNQTVIIEERATLESDYPEPEAPREIALLGGRTERKPPKKPRRLILITPELVDPDASVQATVFFNLTD